jgi:transcriptional regulatory protein RtcR
MKRVVFGFLGTVLDAHGGFGEKRHTTWRPTVSLGLDNTINVSRLELWYDRRYQKLAYQVKEDIEASPRKVAVVLHETQIRDPWNFEEVYAVLFDFVNQYAFNTQNEEYYVHLTTGTHVAQICLFLLAETRAFPAKIIQTNPRGKEGAAPFSIVDLDLSQYDKLAQRFEQKRTSDLEILKAGIHTKNTIFNRIISEIELVARMSVEPMLLLGATGVGKSHLAKQIYQLKRSQHRIDGAFVDVNCATLRGDQAMSALFGHAKGAFTGAATAREGLLKRAHHGLLFLDEIGELGLDEQAMLLRALEDKTFLPVGSDAEVQSEFQLIAGTNCNLLDKVKKGEFREDLLHRINIWSFTLPALKDRREDIEPNLQYELTKFESRSGRRVTFSAEAKDRYLHFALSPSAVWSGNFRDLNASVTRMATLAQQGRITIAVVEQEIARLEAAWGDSSSLEPVARDFEVQLQEMGLTSEGIDLFDQAQLVTVLQVIKNSSSLAEAGRTLFSVSRTGKSRVNDSDRLRKYLARFGLEGRMLLG